MSSDDIRDAIIREAKAAGIPPAYALAVAQRESAFDPSARSSKTIAGLYQMSGSLRRQYGIGDSQDPTDQAKGWMSFIKDTRDQMNDRTGRNVSWPDTYISHHFGVGRGSDMVSGRIPPDTPTADVFTPYERSLNPHIDRAGTVGNLVGSVTSDISRRMGKFGGSDDPFAAFGTPVDGAPDATGPQPMAYAPSGRPQSPVAPPASPWPSEAIPALGATPPVPPQQPWAGVLSNALGVSPGGQ